MNEILLTIILIVISIIGSVITGILVPFLKEVLVPLIKVKIGEYWTSKALYAAEQIFKETAKGLEKNDFVKKFLKKKIPELTDEQIDILIEGTGKALGIFKDKVVTRNDHT